MSDRPSPTYPAIQARAELLDQRVDLPLKVEEAHQRIRHAARAYANAILAASEPGIIVKDTGRIIAALDYIQLSKNSACDALVRPLVQIKR